jgi:hypothetical protein
MPTVVTLAGKQYFMECGLNKETPENLVMRLCTNNVTPTETSVLADFTEATFTGYDEVVTDPADWGVSIVDVGGDDHVVAEHPEIEFVSSAGSQNQTIYCAYLATETSGILIAANRYESGQIANPIVNIGDKKTVTPTLSITPAG